MGQTSGRPTVTKSPRRKPPSRTRYEEANPTVSCRVPKAVYQQLQAARSSQGFSFADTLKAGLGLLETKANEEVELRYQGFEEGYQEGYTDAKNQYLVTYRCWVCQGLIEVEQAEAKGAAAKYMAEHRWGHEACHEKRRKGLA